MFYVKLSLVYSTNLILILIDCSLQATHEIETMKASLREISKVKIMYDNLKQDYDSLHISFESSERIRRQQKELIYVLNKSREVNNAELTSLAAVGTTGRGHSSNVADSSSSSSSALKNTERSRPIMSASGTNNSYPRTATRVDTSHASLTSVNAMHDISKRHTSNDTTTHNYAADNHHHHHHTPAVSADSIADENRSWLNTFNYSELDHYPPQRSINVPLHLVNGNHLSSRHKSNHKQHITADTHTVSQNLNKKTKMKMKNGNNGNKSSIRPPPKPESSFDKTDFHSSMNMNMNDLFNTSAHSSSHNNTHGHSRTHSKSAQSLNNSHLSQLNNNSSYISYGGNYNNPTITVTDVDKVGAGSRNAKLAFVRTTTPATSKKLTRRVSGASGNVTADATPRMSAMSGSGHSSSRSQTKPLRHLQTPQTTVSMPYSSRSMPPTAVLQRRHSESTLSRPSTRYHNNAHINPSNTLTTTSGVLSTTHRKGILNATVGLPSAGQSKSYFVVRPLEKTSK